MSTACTSSVFLLSLVYLLRFYHKISHSPTIYLTNRFLVAIHLFSNRSQMTSVVYRKWSNLIGCYMVQRIVIGPGLPVEWKLIAKAELNCKIHESWRKSWKNQGSFCRQSSPVSRKAWLLSWILQELKEYARKTCGCGQHWRRFHLSFEWK